MSRLDDIATAFLRYLYESSHFRPDVAPFLDDPVRAPDTSPVSIDELCRVLAWLRHRELISLSGVSEDGLAARAGLTGDGLICAGHYRGDVHAWAHATDDTPPAVPEQGPGPDQAPSDEVLAPSSPEPHCPETLPVTGLARVARVLLLTLPTIRAESPGEEATERTARHLLEATRDPTPDAQRIRLLACRLRGELETGPLADTLGIVLLDGLDEALHESRLV